MSQSSNRIDEERVCIDSLVQHLNRAHQGNASIDKDEPIEPPDYWLKLAGQRYAVEITSITDDAGWDARFWSFVSSIEAQFAPDRLPKGTYYVEFFHSPEIPPRGTKKCNALVASAVNAITILEASPPGSVQKISKSASGYLAVAKPTNDGNAIRALGIPGGRWFGDARPELTQKMQEAIDAKRVKIEKKGILRFCPDVILVFYDAYGYGGVEAAREAILGVAGTEWLHSIYWAASFTDRPNVLFPESPGRAGIFLYSRNAAWREPNGAPA
jgi:hypothetical protein